MNKSEVVLTVASWEERFALGSERLIEKLHPDLFVLYYYKEFERESEFNRNKVAELCKGRNIELALYELSFFDPANSWRTLKASMLKYVASDKLITVDITTMPRETILSLLDLLKEQTETVKYVYHRPDHYNQEWLSRDPDRPRLLYRLAGVTRVGIPTALVLLTGYDIDRVKQLIRFFEPKIVLLGLQIGNQFGNKLANVDKCENEFKNKPGISIFHLDAYETNNGYNELIKSIKPYLKTHNIILSSLGPKLSAISLYRLHQNYPSIALAYTPSREFNSDYSSGIGGSIYGSINLRTTLVEDDKDPIL